MSASYETFKDWLSLPEDLADAVPFDIHSRDIEEFSFLKRSIPGIIVSSAGGICPFQVEGLLEGYSFYLRARHGITSLSVTAEDEGLYLNPMWYSWVDDEADIDSLEEFLVKLVSTLEVAERLFEFEGYKLVHTNGTWSVDKSATDTMYSRGFSAEDAYSKLLSLRTNEELEYLQVSPEEWHKLQLAQEFSPEPISGHVPDYPLPAPVFRVVAPGR